MFGLGWSHGQATLQVRPSGLDNDNLYGFVGNDYLYGNNGNDYLNGGTGIDECYGGPASDTDLDCNSFAAVEDVQSPLADELGDAGG